jgi:isopentenyldiphosphate isomerase
MMLYRLSHACSAFASLQRPTKPVIKPSSGTALVAPPFIRQRIPPFTVDAGSWSLGDRAQKLRLNSNNYSNNMSSDDNSEDHKYLLAQNSAELFDVYPAPPTPLHHNTIITPKWGEIYFPCPRPTGERKERCRIHKDGDWHRSIHVWIIQRSGITPQSNGEETVTVLLQRRSPYKDTHPNQLDVSCAGHVNAGDDILETTLRELQEELGGNGAIQQFTLDDVQHSKAFTVTSAIDGETERFGKFICREYQDVFVLEWKGDSPMDAMVFKPLVQEEVCGFVTIDGKELIQRLRNGDAELVPRSIKYIDRLANKLFK